MKNWLRNLAVVAIVAAIAVPSLALAQKAEKGEKKKKGDGAPTAVAQLKKQLGALDLTEEQKKKLHDIMAEYSPKLAEAQKAASEALTPEQRKARQEAAAKAKSDGLKGKAAQEAVAKAINLTGDQKEKADKAEAHLRELVGEMRKAVSGVLTDEQKAKAGLNAPTKGGKKKNNK